MSTAYHPQTDGQTERYNQELEAYLRIYCAYRPDEWSNKLSLAQFAHNARTHEAIKQSPFQLMYGTKPVALPEVSEKTNSPVANDRINQLYKSREEALAAHDLARIKMMERTTNRTKPFKVNDQVWLESKNCIEQFGLDLLRRILAADVERLYDAAIDNVRANQYGVIPKNENPMDLIYMKYTHPLTIIALTEATRLNL
jgi:hypothetical protein